MKNQQSQPQKPDAQTRSDSKDKPKPNLAYGQINFTDLLKAKKDDKISIDMPSLSQKEYSSIIEIARKHKHKKQSSSNLLAQNQKEAPQEKAITNQEKLKILRRNYRLSSTNESKMPSNIELLKKISERLDKNLKNNIVNNKEKGEIINFDEEINNSGKKNKEENENFDNHISENKVDEFDYEEKDYYLHNSSSKKNKKSQQEVDCKIINYPNPNYKNIHEIYEGNIFLLQNKTQNPIYKNFDFIETEISKENYFYDLQGVVLNYSFKEDINIKNLKTMEDKSKSIQNFNNDRNQILFELFDGHGGNNVSIYLQKNFSYIYKQFLHDNQYNIAKSLNEAFLYADEEIKKLPNIETKGATGTIVHIIWERNNKLMIYTANVGDSRVSLISNNKIIRLSQDHRAVNEEERKRVIAEGGIIINNRVNGELMLTRSFGDFEFKNNYKKNKNDENGYYRKGVICVPSISKIEVDLNIGNQYLFLASDGIWDVISEKELQQLIKVNNETEHLPAIIIENANIKKAWDNMSIFAIKLT